MVLIHENMSRGRTRSGWLDAWHTFSFGGFRDPARMGYAALRVLNEDRIVPGAGFSEHAHADMDILTMVLSGRIRHSDTLGNEAEIAAGELQLMSAGSGIRHAEMNASGSDAAHLLQIWLIPDTTGGAPTYQQMDLPAAETTRDWTLLASGVPGEAPLRLLSDTRVSIAAPLAGDTTVLPTAPGRRLFVHLVEGIATVEGERLVAGDGLQVGAEEIGGLLWQTDGRALLFDMSVGRATA